MSTQFILTHFLIVICGGTRNGWINDRNEDTLRAGCLWSHDELYIFLQNISLEDKIIGIDEPIEC